MYPDLPYKRFIKIHGEGTLLTTATAKLAFCGAPVEP